MGLILVELPFQICPPNVEQTLTLMQMNRRMIPVLSAWERYLYSARWTGTIYTAWSASGAFTQAMQTLSSRTGGALFILAGIRHGLIPSSGKWYPIRLTSAAKTSGSNGALQKSRNFAIQGRTGTTRGRHFAGWFPWNPTHVCMIEKVSGFR